MAFSSEKEVYNFFISYAKKKGFGVTKKSVKKVDDGQLKYYSLTCSKFGKSRSNAKRSFNPKPSSKTGCKAKINVMVNDEGSFIISRANLEHNHGLSPSKSQFFRCNKAMDSHVKKRLEVNDEAGISLSKNFQSLVVEAGGYENLPFTERDCRNYIAKARKLRLGAGDAEALCDYFFRMQQRNPSFFYIIDMDEEGRLRNVFWADPRSIVAYESFGDVISFDTTYLTNRYNMPFAPFVGVNQHGQTMLLGCGLLSNEDIKTYIWLFSSWLNCMSGHYPKAIITDQCKAIKAAVAEVFPHSRHRFCLWHIMRKIPKKLGGLAKYKEVKKILKSAVYESVKVYEFEQTWGKMIKDFNLERNEWLNSLYDVRSYWVPAYIKNTFWAGMSTTQRSESVNAFFDGYVGAQTSLKQFVEQYDNALKSKIENENKADFASYNSSIPMITRFFFEKQFQEAYTNENFKMFQEEIQDMMYCNLDFDSVDGSISKFRVKDYFRGKDGRFKQQVVYDVCFNEVECDIKCSCCMFEFKGILCRHVVKVLIEKNVKEVPHRYILDRWRKDIKRRHTFIKSCCDDFDSSEKKLRYTKLCSKFYKVAVVGVESKENYEFLLNCIDDALDRIMKRPNSKGIDLNHVSMEPRMETNEGHQEISTIPARLLSPLKARAKGRPPSKRKQSTIEKIVEKKKRSKKKVNPNYNGVINDFDLNLDLSQRGEVQHFNCYGGFKETLV
ncbi:hypothetical protein SLEP1_g26523 [Rubroshorea leprosula]|uniref:Protein FAR1-RELATED SEQUENCE n=1 Tax=Rubroshorea leprosula TaxID=152421 RepID=A0AAV5JST1_9ROSI|nr:hypothetical protein SLEP1_g26523 [Rubroshorea leprosula]